jgi:integrase
VWYQGGSVKQAGGMLGLLPPAKSMLLVAYHSGMHKGEVRSLRWNQVDLKTGLIRLKSGDTKTAEGRVIPLNQALTTLLKSSTRYLGCPWVLVNPVHMDAWQASPEAIDLPDHAAHLTHAFVRASKAGVANTTFHDLRPFFVTDARRARIDDFHIMAITWHKTMAVFKRHNIMDEADLQHALSQMDTYIDANPEVDTAAQDVNAGNISPSRRSSAGRATDS